MCQLITVATGGGIRYCLGGYNLKLVKELTLILLTLNFWEHSHVMAIMKYIARAFLLAKAYLVTYTFYLEIGGLYVIFSACVSKYYKCNKVPR